MGADVGLRACGGGGGGNQLLLNHGIERGSDGGMFGLVWFWLGKGLERGFFDVHVDCWRGLWGCRERVIRWL